MKIEDPAALRFIMEDDIYLLPEDRKSAPITPASPAVVETQNTPLNYLGNHTKSFLIVVHYTTEEFIADAHLAALENILKRKDYALDDVAIFNIAKYTGVDFEQLQNHFKAQKLLLLGKEALPPNMDNIQFNQIQKLTGCSALYSFSFDEMMDNTDNKKAFWEQMKNL